MKQEIFENISLNFQQQLEPIFKEEKEKFKEVIESYLQLHEYKLLDDEKKIEEFSEKLNEFLTSNQKEKRKRTNSKKTNPIEPVKKRKIPQEIQTPILMNNEDENFIVCGRSNSRGKPCMRRKGTCPYHSEE